MHVRGRLHCENIAVVMHNGAAELCTDGALRRPSARSSAFIDVGNLCLFCLDGKVFYPEEVCGDGIDQPCRLYVSVFQIEARVGYYYVHKVAQISAYGVGAVFKPVGKLFFIVAVRQHDLEKGKVHYVGGNLARLLGHRTFKVHLLAVV